MGFIAGVLAFTAFMLFSLLFCRYAPIPAQWRNNRKKTITIVLYTKDDEANIEHVVSRVVNVAENWLGGSYRLVCVDRGSRDDTLHIMKKLQLKNSRITVFRLASSLRFHPHPGEGKNPLRGESQNDGNNSQNRIDSFKPPRGSSGSHLSFGQRVPVVRG